MWERTLQDLIRGLRANKKDEAKFIAQAVNEIRQEVKSKDMGLKAGAVLKLTYLEMLGYDMSWASFHVVEVMSSPKYHLKAVGYLAATQSFGPDTDVLMLTTNLLKKDLTSNPHDIAISLNGLSHTISPDLARDLSHDIVTMLNHSKPHIRKRAVIAVYKALVKYPEATPFALTRLKERLEDQDAGVVAATINVLCEMVRREPADYLSLAPQLFRLMTTSSNNWMLIKLIKLFGFLSPHEPRLVKKLQPPITQLISTTPAISLLYECVHTCIVGGMLQHASGDSLAELCVTKLATFLQDPDQNLKYIAFLALAKIVPTHRNLVAQYQDMILSSINDQDLSIRMRALDLLSAMVTRDNLQSIVQQLLSYLVRPDVSPFPAAAQSLTQNISSSTSNGTGPILAPTQLSSYRLAVVQRLLAMCSHDTYDNVVDFQWYLSVLLDLTYVATVKVGDQIRGQLVDIVARVRGVNRWAVELMTRLLRDDTFLANSQEEGSCAEVLWAAAWICGENSREIAEPQKLLPHLLQPNVSLLAPETIGVYLQTAVKLFGAWSMELSQNWDNGRLQDVREVVDTLISRLKTFTSHFEIDVQERAANAVQLFNFIRADLASFSPEQDMITDHGTSLSQTPTYPKSLLLINPLFSVYELNSVNVSAQDSIPVPDSLDLDTWIASPPREFTLPDASTVDGTEGDERLSTKKKVKGKGKGKGKGKEKSSKDAILSSQTDPIPSVGLSETEEERIEREKRRLERIEFRRHDPYYIADRPSSAPSANDIDSIPVVRLDDLPPLSRVEEPQYPSLLRDSASVIPSEPFVVDKSGEMPEGVVPPPDAKPPLIPAVATRSSSTDTMPQVLSSFPAYVVDEEIPRAGTPEPIKVKRPKKGASSARPKRTVTE
ncbi:adaptin N terminal region-domain-containing protein [Russula earlei]|uniref:Adaptin N terminal region-domain-containing protein n=1 Tax=Russula earlei TaxID=71964 RepID=A0ACC0UNF6_9AGAM|nr:adaptin N terminal region-domain-containing protein [Russula earlei]